LSVKLIPGNGNKCKFAEEKIVKSLQLFLADFSYLEPLCIVSKKKEVGSIALSLYHGVEIINLGRRNFGYE